MHARRGQEPLQAHPVFSLALRFQGSVLPRLPPADRHLLHHQLNEVPVLSAHGVWGIRDAPISHLVE